MTPYYYSKMTKEEQAVYYALRVGLNRLDREIQVPAVDPDRLSEIFFQLRLDSPALFWAPGYSYRSVPGAASLTVLPDYLFEKTKIREHQQAMAARIEKLARPAAAFSEWEKERYIHDFICSNVRYDKLKKAYSHEITGPLGHGTGVCEGIAKSVKALCDALGLWCMIVLCGSNPEKGIKYRHAWNLVQIQGRYYHLDATFDNTLGKGEEIRYDYFNLDDRSIFRDHEPLIAPAPACTDGSFFYYKEKKLSFTREEDVYRRSLQAAKKGKSLTFHWRGGPLTRTVLQELVGQMERAGREQEKTAQVSLNWPQAVIRLRYTREAGTAAVVTAEDANEGERD